MAAATTIALIGLGISAAAAGGQAYYSNQASRASRRAERLREQQMRMDARRRRIQAIRQSMMAGSLATARGANQGVGEGSSVIGGAAGQTAGELGRELSYTNASEQIGAGIFQANADIAGAQGMASLFNAAGTIGNTLLGNAQTISNIGASLFTPAASSNWATTVTPTPAYNPTATPTLAPINVPLQNQQRAQAAYPYGGY